MQTTNEPDYRKYLALAVKRKRLFITTALAIMTVVLIVSYFLPKKYEAKSTVFIEKSIIGELVRGLAVTPSMEDKIKGLNYAISSRSLLMKVIEDLGQGGLKLSDGQVESLVAKFQKDTSLKLKNDENLFTISFVNEDPKLARDFVNALVRRYIEENTSAKREESYGASKFLSEQIADFKGKMDKAEAEVNNFRRDKGILIATDPATLEREINAAQQRIDEIQLRRSQLEASRAQIKKNNPMQTRLLALQKKLDDMRIEYTDTYPEIVRLKTEIESVKEHLRSLSEGGNLSPTEVQELERIDSDLRALGSVESKQNSHIAVTRSMLHQIPAARAQLDTLEREKNSQKTLYDQLVARHGQSEFSKQMEVQDKSTTFRIVDPAVLPVKPISPNRVNIILMGILGGIAAAFALLLLLDYLDHSVKSIDSLKAVGLPILAVIPRMQVEETVKLQQRKDKRLYAMAGCYFSCIIGVLLVEVFGIVNVDACIDALNLKQYLTNLKSAIK